MCVKVRTAHAVNKTGLLSHSYNMIIYGLDSVSTSFTHKNQSLSNLISTHLAPEGPLILLIIVISFERVHKVESTVGTVIKNVPISIMNTEQTSKGSLSTTL